jgi:hypothetical protein
MVILTMKVEKWGVANNITITLLVTPIFMTR